MSIFVGGATDEAAVARDELELGVAAAPTHSRELKRGRSLSPAARAFAESLP